MTKNYKLLTYYFYIVFLVLTPVVLVILDSRLLDNKPSFCLSILLFNEECYGCGMGRALFHLLHFDFKEAFYYNGLSFFIFPLLLFLWIQEVSKIRKRITTL